MTTDSFEVVRHERFEERARDFVLAVVEESGQTSTWLARESGLMPSTLNNFLNRPVEHTLSLTTIGKIEEACVRHGLKARFQDFLDDAA